MRHSASLFNERALHISKSEPEHLRVHCLEKSNDVIMYLPSLSEPNRIIFCDVEIGSLVRVLARSLAGS